MLCVVPHLEVLLINLGRDEEQRLEGDFALGHEMRLAQRLLIPCTIPTQRAIELGVLLVLNLASPGGKGNGKTRDK